MFVALLLLADAAPRKRTPPPPPPPPEPDGWWDPARDVWTPEALQTSLRQVEKKVAPSSFLGDTQGMAPFEAVEWAWFAEGFEPEHYQTVALAPPRNGMGRYELVGENLLRKQEILAFREVTRTWRKADVGTDADLVVYTNLRWSLTSESGVAWVVENIGVDADKNVVFRTQLLAGAAPPLTGELPSDKERFSYLQEVATEAGTDLAAALRAAGSATNAGAPRGPKTALHCERAALVSPRAESFGPTLTAQIAAAVSTAADATVLVEERIRRMTLLGHLGAAAGVPVLTATLLDTSLDPRLRAAAAWAAGEIGHPNALPTLLKVRGVDPFLVKTAIVKVDEY